AIMAGYRARAASPDSSPTTDRTRIPPAITVTVVLASGSAIAATQQPAPASAKCTRSIRDSLAGICRFISQTRARPMAELALYRKTAALAMARLQRQE